MNENLELLPAIKEEPDVKKELHIKEIPGVKQEPGVKKEPVKCDYRIPLRKEGREILMEFSRNRKKIIYLNDSNTLFGEYNKLLVSDSSLSDLLFSAYPIFQEFNPKFKTWVDIDHEENLIDGAVVKVRFFFKRTESDGSYPGSIKRKRDDFDTEPNPKQRRVHQDGNENDLDLLSKCLDRNEIENVDPKSRANILSLGIRNCRSVNRPRRRYSRNAVSVRKNLFPRFRSNSLDRWGSDRNPDQVVPLSAGSEKKQWFLMPEEINTNIQVTSTDVQPHLEAALSHLEPLHPSYAVEQTTGAVLSERQMNVTSTDVQPHLEAALSHSEPLHPSYAVEQTTGAVLSERQMNDAPSYKVALIERKPTGHQKSTLKPEVCNRSITWTTSYSRTQMQKRRAWASKNKGRKWKSTVFSEVASFGLEGNRIKLFDNFYHFKEGYEIFLGFRSFDGRNSIIVPLGSELKGFDLGEVFENKVVRSVKDHFKSSHVTFQHPTFLTQFGLKYLRKVLNKNSISSSVQPPSVQDLSPAYHAWKLVGEKVKNIQCSSRQEMISIVSGVWENDLNVQLMCTDMISLLPQIIKSVEHQKGNGQNIQNVVTV